MVCNIDYSPDFLKSRRTGSEKEGSIDSGIEFGAPRYLSLTQRLAICVGLPLTGVESVWLLIPPMVIFGV